MSGLPISALLPDGERLHLNHGPIDLIVGADGPERDQAFAEVIARFGSVLTGLVDELSELKSDYSGQSFADPIAQRMARAVSPYASEHFVTPMAAVAGAVADEMLETLVQNRNFTKAYVNNGGDIAFALAEQETLRVAAPNGTIDVKGTAPYRGIATSGWRGRSFSLGIADAVTVLASSAAVADVAATLIANHVDLPGHPDIVRQPAHKVETHSELGDRMVTVEVPDLPPSDVAAALNRGAEFAQICMKRGLIIGAVLALQGETRVIPDEQHGRLPS